MTGSPVLLKSPFFTLEYDPENACLKRGIPPGAEDLGDGIFKWKGLLFRLGEGPGDPPENKFLKSETISGKGILAIARRGYNPLIKSAPVMAEREDRLMEMAFQDGPPLREDLKPGDKIKPGSRPYGKTEIRIILLSLLPKGEDGFSLEGLPNFRFRKNRIYELIPREIIDELFGGDNDGGFSPLVLKNAEIPGFADDHARLIYVFADKTLYDYLCQDNLFISPKEVSLVLRCAPIMERCAGKAAAFPALKYGDDLFSAQALSRRFQSLYLAIKDKWIRRESLELIGIGPLGRYINGESLAGFRITGREVLLRKSERKNSLFRSLEWDRDRWIASGSEDEIFSGHLDFLRAWGCGGGVIRNDREKAAQSLADYLHSLWEEIGEAEKHSETEELFDTRIRSKILALLPASFWNHWLCKELPQSGDGPLTFPPGRYAGADSVWDPAFRGIGLAFYRDIPALKKKAPWDILITAGLEEALAMDESAGEDLLGSLLSIPARLKLGIFFSASGVFDSPHSEKLKNFFRIKGKQKEIEKYLIRECGDFVTLPEAPGPSPLVLLKPSRPWETEEKSGSERELPFDGEAFIFGGGRFIIEAKFQKIQGAEYQAEQSELNRGAGTPVKDLPVMPLEGDYNSLTEEEKNCFFYWRSEFREGRERKTCMVFLYIYCRELILLLGGIKPRHAFEELRRLKKSYGEIFPDFSSSLSRLFLDLAIIHRCLDLFIPENSSSGLEQDLFLHKKYIEENHVIEFADFLPLIPRKLREGPFRRSEQGHLLDEAAEKALNHADRVLRKLYRKKLLEFFYPQPARKKIITAFENFKGLGYSAYTAEWLSFSGHRAFIRFLVSLTAFLEFRLKKEVHFIETGTAPRLDPLWKFLAGISPDEDPPPFGEELKSTNLSLRPDKIRILREESDAVMEMLKTENSEAVLDSEAALNFEVPGSGKENPAKSAKAAHLPSPSSNWMPDFLDTLDETEAAALALLADGKSAKELDDFARLKGSLGELIIDGINSKFLKTRGDLLIETSVDAGHEISAYYKEEVIWCLTFQKG